MKITLFLAVAFTSIVSSAQTEDNRELIEMYAAQERDKSARCVDIEIRLERSKIRAEKALSSIESIPSPTANDYANAAEILHSQHDSISNNKVVELMEKAVALDPKRNRKLYAQAVDQQLYFRNQPQIYGTQSHFYFDEKSPSGEIRMYEIDTTQVADSQRIAFGLRTLAEERKHIFELQQRYLCDLMKDGKSIHEIIDFCKKEFKENSTSKYVTERQLNLLGIQLKRDGQLENASKIYKLSTELYPNSYESFDHLAEVYSQLAYDDQAIAALKRSLELNPDGYCAQQKLEDYLNH